MTKRRSEWFVDYDAACAELRGAKAQYDLANSLYAAASARLTRAQSECGRLFQQGMMLRRECKCGRLYCDGPLITTDWAYWDKDGPTCPECLGIDVEAEMERVSGYGQLTRDCDK